MATQNPRPRGDASLGRELRALRDEVKQLRRLLVVPESTAILVQISDEENLSWPVGTAWLDTSGE